MRQSIFFRKMTLFAVLLILLIPEVHLTSFPKILWIYWEQGYQNAPLFTKFSIRNKQHYANLSGWKLNLLTSKNLHQYIDLQKISDLMQEHEFQSPQLRSDIIRQLLLLQYGGMWMDANSIFLRDLSWTETLQTDKSIYNKIGSEPELIISAYTGFSTGGGNITYVFDQKLNQTINLFPGYEAWFMLAKPNSTFINRTLTSIVNIFGTPKAVMDETLLKQGIHLSKQHLDPYFLGSDYVFQVEIQRKQKQLEKTKNQTKYAVEYFKMWNFEADQNVYRMAKFERFKRYQMWADLMTFSSDQLIELIHELPKFWKFVGWMYPEYSYFLSNYGRLNCWGFDSIIQKQSHIDRFLIGQQQELSSNIRNIFKNKQSREYCINQIMQENKKSSKHISIEIFIICIFIGFFGIFVGFYKLNQKVFGEQQIDN